MSLWSEIRFSIEPHSSYKRRKSVRKFVETFPSIQGEDYTISDIEDCLFVVRLREGGNRAYKILYNLHKGLEDNFEVVVLSIAVRYK